MRFEVTQKGVQGHDVGDIIELEGDIVPGWLLNKGNVLTDKVAVTNPADGGQVAASAAERQQLLAAAAAELDDDGFNAEGVPKVQALNAELTDDAPKFTAEERDALWPGVAEDVKAARA